MGGWGVGARVGGRGRRAARLPPRAPTVSWAALDIGTPPRAPRPGAGRQGRSQAAVSFFFIDRDMRAREGRLMPTLEPAARAGRCPGHQHQTLSPPRSVWLSCCRSIPPTTPTRHGRAFAACWRPRRACPTHVTRHWTRPASRPSAWAPLWQPTPCWSGRGSAAPWPSPQASATCSISAPRQEKLERRMVWGGDRVRQRRCACHLPAHPTSPTSPPPGPPRHI